MALVIAFVSAHSVLLASLVVAVLDLIFALNPKAESSGILHFIYVQAKNLLAKKPEEPKA